jgi:hypothetical protein
MSVLKSNLDRPDTDEPRNGSGRDSGRPVVDPWSVIPPVRVELTFHCAIFEQLGLPTEHLLYHEAGLLVQQLLYQLFQGGCRARILAPNSAGPDLGSGPDPNRPETEPVPAPARTLTDAERAEAEQLLQAAHLRPGLERRIRARLGLES